MEAKEHDIKKSLRLSISFSNKDLTIKYNKRYLKNKIDFNVVAKFVPQNNLFNVKISLISPVDKISKKYEIISLSNT